jgi:DNA polymerase-3 subunit epsilon
MFSEPVVFIDIETNGGNSKKSRVIEIGAIRIEEGRIIDEYKTLVNPGSPLPYWITKITGLTDADLTQAPYFDEIAYQLNKILEGATFIAHNVRFDYSFIKRQLEACGYPFKPKLLCTVRLSRALYPEAQGHSLEKIINRHGIKVNARHRAYDDAKAIMDFTELAFKEHGQEKFRAALAVQAKNQTIPPNLNQSAMDSVGNKPGVYIFEDEAGRPLYVGKSKQLRTRLMSHFNQDIKNSKEMKLSQSVHNIRTIETKSELEALLSESKLVKELLPIHNRQLRRHSELSIVLSSTDEAGYTTVKVESVRQLAPEMLESVYGVYTSKKKAKSALDTKQRTYGLCPKLLGIEKAKNACFLYQLGKCRGACIGKEAPDSYNQRLEIAMQRSRIESWPYGGPILISESVSSKLVVDRWVITGRVNTKNKVSRFKPMPALFDIDSYRILRSYLASSVGKGSVQPFKAT